MYTCMLEYHNDIWTTFLEYVVDTVMYCDGKRQNLKQKLSSQMIRKRGVY